MYIELIYTRLRFNWNLNLIDVCVTQSRFIRPLLQYVDVVWDNSPEYLEQINYEAASL